MTKQIIIFLAIFTLIIGAIILFPYLSNDDKERTQETEETVNKDFAYLDATIKKFNAWSGGIYYGTKDDIETVCAEFPDTKKAYIFSLNNKALGLISDEVNAFCKKATLGRKYTKTADTIINVLKSINEKSIIKDNASAKLDDFKNIQQTVYSVKNYVYEAAYSSGQSASKRNKLTNYQQKINSWDNEKLNREISICFSLLKEHKTAANQFDYLREKCSTESDCELVFKSRKTRETFNYYVEKCKSFINN